MGREPPAGGRGLSEEAESTASTPAVVRPCPAGFARGERPPGERSRYPPPAWRPPGGGVSSLNGGLEATDPRRGDRQQRLPRRGRAPRLAAIPILVVSAALRHAPGRSSAARSSARWCCCTAAPRSTTRCRGTRAKQVFGAARPRRDLPADRRLLHAVRARRAARAVGLVAARRDLGARDPGRRLQDALRAALPARLDGRLPAMGWMAVFACRPLMASVAPAGIALLVAGGLCYTLGIVFYALEAAALRPPRLAPVRARRDRLPLLRGPRLRVSRDEVPAARLPHNHPPWTPPGTTSTSW